MKRRELLTAAAAMLGAPALVSAQAGGWPTRGPIRLIAQFPPGGLVDVVSGRAADRVDPARCGLVRLGHRQRDLAAAADGMRLGQGTSVFFLVAAAVQSVAIWCFLAGRHAALTSSYQPRLVA